MKKQANLSAKPVKGGKEVIDLSVLSPMIARNFFNIEYPKQRIFKFVTLKPSV